VYGACSCRWWQVATCNHAPRHLKQHTRPQYSIEWSSIEHPSEGTRNAPWGWQCYAETYRSYHALLINLINNWCICWFFTDTLRSRSALEEDWRWFLKKYWKHSVSSHSFDKSAVCTCFRKTFLQPARIFRKVFMTEQKHFIAYCRCNKVAKLFRFLLSPHRLERTCQICAKLHWLLTGRR
jgi:hypothetical protein